MSHQPGPWGDRFTRDEENRAVCAREQSRRDLTPKKSSSPGRGLILRPRRSTARRSSCSR